jgi:hypothetical protein
MSELPSNIYLRYMWNLQAEKHGQVIDENFLDGLWKKARDCL